MARGWTNPYLLLALLVGIVCLPFIDQPFHIDDRIYLEVADNILKKPLYPYDYPAIHEGFQAPDAASHSHLPLTSYYLALVKVLAGSDREWPFHLAFLVFPILAAWGMYDLAGRFVRLPLAAAALLVVSPVFLVLSHTLMTDVPLLCFWILAFSRFLRIQDETMRRADWAILVLSLLGGAFISLTTIIPVSVFAFGAVVTGRPADQRTRRQLAVVLALPFVLWFLWFLLAYVHYGRFVLIRTFQHMNHRAAFDWGLIQLKGLSFVLNIGGVFTMPVVAWIALARGFRLRVALLVFGCAFIPFYSWVSGWSWPDTFLFALFLSTGVLILASLAVLLPGKLRSLIPPYQAGEVAASRKQAQSWGLLFLWFGAVLVACLVIYYSGSVRYTLPALPVIILLVLAQLERVSGDYFRRNLVSLVVLLTAVYSLWISVGDYRFASVYRDAAAELSQSYARPAHSIWITGEWGFRHYMNRAGARTLLQTATGPKAGDVIIKPRIAMPWVTLYDPREYTDLVEQRHVKSSSRIRLLDFSSHAGFYSTGWGVLPFSIRKADDRWEWFNIYRVKKEYEGPVPEPTRPW
ncbi:MAG TPA: glycosyltransferase family 39 protein [Acidobacteriota bacterium]|nr:glycosyltransferase family 39 protein [Acidobacteriota bacterium]